jgi:hypothetical protein
MKSILWIKILDPYIVHAPKSHDQWWSGHRVEKNCVFFFAIFGTFGRFVTNPKVYFCWKCKKRPKATHPSVQGYIFTRETYLEGGIVQYTKVKILIPVDLPTEIHINLNTISTINGCKSVTVGTKNLSFPRNDKKYVDIRNYYNQSL